MSWWNSDKEEKEITPEGIIQEVGVLNNLGISSKEGYYSDYPEEDDREKEHG